MPEHIYLIRHGEAYNNIPPDGFREIEHPANPPLTPLGKQQALELKPVLAAFRPDAVIVSPFLRTVQTIHPFVTRGGWVARIINCQDHLTQTNGQIVH